MSKTVIEKRSLRYDFTAEGWEYREIDCDVLYHQPTQGKKTIIRRDTNKKTSVESMTDFEWDLFNQPGNGTHESETVDTDAEVVEEESNGPKLIGN